MGRSRVNQTRDSGAEAERRPAMPSETTPEDQHPYVVTTMAAEDIDVMARLHVASFGDSFLATMGEPFLRHYFRAFLEDRRGVGLVCRQRDDGSVVGFVCGSEDVAKHYRGFMKRRLVPSIPSVASRVVREPRLAGAVVQRVWKVGKMNLAAKRPGADRLPAQGPALPPASLMTIGVDPRYRRQGIGELLTQAFTFEMGKRGIPRIKLGVRADNAGARKLYERLGWRQVPAAGGNDEGASCMYVRDIQTHQPVPRLRQITRTASKSTEDSDLTEKSSKRRERE